MNTTAASFYAEGRNAYSARQLNPYDGFSFAGRNWEAGFMDAAAAAQVERVTMDAFRFAPCSDLRTRMTHNSSASR